MAIESKEGLKPAIISGINEVKIDLKSGDDKKEIAKDIKKAGLDFKNEIKKEVSKLKIDGKEGKKYT